MHLTKYQVKVRVDRKHSTPSNKLAGKKTLVSKTKVKRHLAIKTHPHLQLAIRAGLKNKAWLALTKKIAGSTRLQPALNLDDIDEKTSAGDTIVVPGKILANGDLTKKLKLVSLSISAHAKEKLKKTKSEWTPLYQEIQSNSKAEGVKILP
ncbi:MAG: hypothetical protein AABY00_03415 [Nanoarchaeota archaeon]